MPRAVCKAEGFEASQASAMVAEVEGSGANLGFRGFRIWMALGFPDEPKPTVACLPVPLAGELSFLQDAPRNWATALLLGLQDLMRSHSGRGLLAFRLTVPINKKGHLRHVCSWADEAALSLLNFVSKAAQEKVQDWYFKQPLGLRA